MRLWLKSLRGMAAAVISLLLAISSFISHVQADTSPVTSTPPGFGNAANQPPVSTTATLNNPDNNPVNNPSLNNTDAAAATAFWNLRDVDIHTLINEVALQTHQNFIIDPRVQGKVNLINTKPIRPDEVYSVFETILQLYGYSAVKSGTMTKILPTSDAIQSNSLIASKKKPGVGDEIVVKVIPLKFNSAMQLVPLLRPLIPSTGTINAYMPSNSLIIAATADNVERLSAVVLSLDAANDQSIEIVPLRYAIADDVVKELMQLKPQQTYDKPSMNFSADTNSNSVLIAGNFAERLKARALIEELDHQNSINRSGNTRVFHLQYLKAVDLVPVLAHLVGMTDANVNISNTPTSGNAALNSNEANSASNSATGSDSSSNATSAPSNTTGGSAQSGVQQITTASITSKSGNVEIAGEPNTNTILITAPQSIMRSLATVINRLDARPAQVLIEAAIVEIDQAKLNQLGIEWGTNNRTTGEPPSVAGDTEFNTITGGLGVGFIHHGSLKAMVSALARDSATNILSTPTIIVMDNQQAEIKVGKMVPFITGQYSTSSAGSLNNPYTTTDRKYVGLKLAVIPQINLGHTVRLLIDQGNETIADGSQNSQNPVTDQSAIDTSVMVNDGEILVLGGLISNQLEAVLHKVPILGDLPAIGKLFQNKEHTLERRKLMVFLRPVILRSSAAGSAITSKDYNTIRRDQIGQFYHQDIDGFGVQPTVLPPLHGKADLPAPFGQG